MRSARTHPDEREIEVHSGYRSNLYLSRALLFETPMRRSLSVHDQSQGDSAGA